MCEGPYHNCEVFGDCGIGAGGAGAALDFGTNNLTSEKYGNYWFYGLPPDSSFLEL